MAAACRKLLPASNPQTAAERFAWIARALRASSPDAEVRRTQTFAQLLNSHLEEHLQPASINRLETGTLDFTIERCLAYEAVLKLPSLQLVDAYLWLFRHRGLTPKTNWSNLREATSAEIDIMIKLAQGEPLSPLDWLHFAHLYRNRPDLINESGRLRELFFDGLVHDMGRYYERDQRILREALIIVGEDAIPAIMAAVEDEPIRFFNTTEALGFIPGPAAWEALLHLQQELPDVFAVPGILDSIVRKADLDCSAKFSERSTSGSIKSQCVELLDRADTLFIAREASLATVQRLRPNLTSLEGRRLASLRSDLQQLAVRPAGVGIEEIMAEVMRRHQRTVERERESYDLPLVLPGLDRIVADGLFARDRVERITNAVLLAPWIGVDALTDAVGSVACEISNVDYGTQRSLVRFVTKLGSKRAYKYFRDIASTPGVDFNTSISIAWALGAGVEDEDELTLDQMYASSESPEVRRAVCTGAMRRGRASLLMTMSRDRDGVVAREAMVGLGLLRARGRL